MSFYLGECISFHAPPDCVFRRYQNTEFRLPIVLFALAVYGPVYTEFCSTFDWFLNAPGTVFAASALDRFVYTVHGSQFSEDGRCSLQYGVTKRSRAPVQKHCCNVLEVRKSHTLGGKHDFCHMSVGVTSNTYCNSMYCTFTVTSTVTYIIRDFCHVSVGVTSNTYCNSMYCTFTVTSTLTYIIRDLCHISVGVTSIPTCNSMYCTFTVTLCPISYVTSVTSVKVTSNAYVTCSTVPSFQLPLSPISYFRLMYMEFRTLCVVGLVLIPYVPF